MDASVTRLGRAAGAASLSTFLALALHVIAGGHAPSTLAVVAPLAAAFAVAFQLAGGPLGRWRLALVIAASQVALHVTFSVGAAPDAHPGGHASHGTVTLGGMVSVHASMPLAHAVAGVLTYVGIRRASRVLGALAALGALVARVLLAPLGIRAAAPPPAAPRIVPAPRPPRAAPAALLASLPSRAPPAVA